MSTSGIVTCLVVVAVILLWCVWYVITTSRSNRRKISLLLDALENGDTSVRFPTRRDHDVNDMLNRINSILKSVKLETAERERYYQLILERINAGVFSFDDAGRVYQVNAAALHLLGLNVFTHLKQLSKVDAELGDRLAALGNNDRIEAEISVDGDRRTLSVSISEISMHSHRSRVVVLDDISVNLDRKEEEAWVKLIRVMIHEIMNSLGPITSLSETLIGISDTQPAEIREGLDTINSTSRSLVNFVSSYRRLVNTPRISPVLFNVRPLLERIAMLGTHICKSGTVEISVGTCDSDLIAYADEDIMGNVLTNLVKNAVEAVNGLPDGNIVLNAGTQSDGSVTIEVTDNGLPLSDDIVSQMFVPFFTTKKGGSGIGLSLSRRLIQLHGGTLTMRPAPSGSRGVTFIITLP